MLIWKWETMLWEGGALNNNHVVHKEQLPRFDLVN